MNTTTVTKHLPSLLLTAFLFSTPACYAELNTAHQTSQSQSQSQHLSIGLKAYDNKNWDLAYEHLMPLAIKGNPKAMGRIGSLYRDGKGGVEQDYAEAMRWYRMAAEKGDVNGQYNLGLMYATGDGVEKDYKEAMILFVMAANQGDAKSQAAIGAMYQNGTGVEQSDKEAMKWYRKAEKQGNPYAIQNIAGMLAAKPVYEEPQESNWHKKERLDDEHHDCVMHNSGCYAN